MEQTVYVDLLLLVNFSMDFLSGYVTTVLLRREPRPGRLIGAALLGASYSVLSLFLPLPGPLAIVADGAVCFAMCALLFWGRHIPLRFFGLSAALFVGVSMALGGIMTALFELCNRAGVADALLRSGGGNHDGPSAWLFALLAAVSTLASLRGGKLLRRSAARRFARLSVTLLGRQVEVQALVDSGNLCRDPISGRPVVFLEPSRAARLLGEDRAQLAPRYRVIPVETVEGRRLCPAYLPDRMEVQDSGGTHAVEALICPAETLTGAQGYGAILPAELVT